jgi:hypothetical protein
MPFTVMRVVTNITLSFVCFPITPFTVRLVLIRSNVSFAVEEVR